MASPSPLELSPVLHQSHLLVSAMVHFISQLQYYIAFEVGLMDMHALGLLAQQNSTNFSAIKILAFQLAG